MRALEWLRVNRSLASILASIAALTTRALDSQGRAFDEYDYIIAQLDVSWLAVYRRPTYSCSAARIWLKWKGIGREQNPSRLSSTSSTSTHDYGLSTVPQPHAWKSTRYIGPGRVYWVAALLAHYGAPSDFDEFAEIVGDNSWSWENFKAVLSQIRELFLQSSIPECRCSQARIIGTINAGIPFNPDFNTSKRNHRSEQVTYIDRRGVRVSTEAAYLTPTVLARSNLKVVTEARVTKILFDTSTPNRNPRAIGVDFSSFVDKGTGKRFRARARREVIVCCGAVHTPQLLMLSGIGPATHLTEHNIPVVINHPGVGSNLSDHPAFHLRFAEKMGISFGYLQPSDLYTKLKLWRDILQYQLWGTGPLSSNFAEGAAFCRSDDPVLFPEYRHHSVQDSTSGPDSPDLELVAISVLIHTDPSRGIGNGFMILPILLRPTSVGTVRLKSADPWDDPLIDPNYLSTQHDIDVLARGVRLAVKIAHTPPLSDLTDSTDNDPNLDHHLGRLSDVELQQILRNRTETAFHPAGTCAMGREGATGTVLDPQMRVRGISGLRVCDASILPKLVSGHTTGVVIAAAEKLADMIKAEYK
ncbi:hypothetical protein EDC04DRAFT_3139081 [Pisolithus marmoratus]|nr:hypothetical protein EDC04DRAFT_3139081 [Pisolithus marmoratus]